MFLQDNKLISPQPFRCKEQLTHFQTCINMEQCNISRQCPIVRSVNTKRGRNICGRLGSKDYCITSRYPSELPTQMTFVSSRLEMDVLISKVLGLLCSFGLLIIALQTAIFTTAVEHFGMHSIFFFFTCINFIGALPLENARNKRQNFCAD
ncbi:hypothetical protein MSG28_012691 [Choristoneura fumiferana]|uniref:Uncharacterized protein n=1 Tax=Choristoneura fumiferana TaxID=7141 RepID=A0ACC0JHP0_CHOFU|nr:hypothetical protein MSG28_012691 [Choristoneura fumiferana]